MIGKYREFGAVELVSVQSINWWWAFIDSFQQLMVGFYLFIQTINGGRLLLLLLWLLCGLTRRASSEKTQEYILYNRALSLDDDSGSVRH